MPLFPLAFGQSHARRFSSASLAADAMSATLPSLQLFDTRRGAQYCGLVANAAIGSLQLSAHSSTACRMAVGQTSMSSITIPFAGRAATHCDGNQFILEPGVAVLFPTCHRVTERKDSSALLVSFDPLHILHRLEAITGQPAAAGFPASPQLQRIVPGPHGFAALTQICRLIDTLGSDQASMAALGVDDLVYRWIAMTFLTVNRLPDGELPTTSRIDVVCDLIRAAGDRPLTLTEMELASGLSARMLQYGFKARFGCTPMQWQRRERLSGARKRMLSMRPGETITSVAHELGFSSSAAFTTLYRQQFGETPRDTLRRGV